MGDLLAGDFAHLGMDVYDSNGRHADLSFLPQQVVGRAIISPDGRFIAYETEGEDAERPGNAAYLYDRQRGQAERVTPGGSDLLGWSGDSRYFYVRSRNYLRVEPLGASGERVVALNHFAPDPTGAQPVVGTADGRHLIWQVGSQMNGWMFIHRTAVTDVEGNESSNNRAYRLADQLFEPYAFSLSPDERYLAYFTFERAGLYVRLVDGRAEWQLNQNARIHRLAWSPDGERLLVWATVDCLLTGAAPPPNCHGDLYLFDLTNLVAEEYATAARLTDSQIPFDQITGLHWFKQE
jgi:Tol biopolymer transport system component